MHRWAAATVCLLLLGGGGAGCGAIGDTGGGSSYVPVSGSGPFRPLVPGPTYDKLNVPFVLLDPAVDMDDPFVVEWEDQLALWVTARRSNVTDIEHADALSLEEGFGALFQALVADRAWEAGAVTEPSLIAGDPVVPGGVWILFYAAGGALGWATAPAVTLGHEWTKAPGPALLANGAEEGHVLSSPAVVRIDDRVRVYYLAEGALWAVDAPFDDVVTGRATTWVRLDGDPATPARDPMLRAPSWASAIGHVSARAVRTPVGRWRHDLYVTVMVPATDRRVATSSAAFASSFTGDRFATGDKPILPLDQPRRGPAETPYRRGALLLYIEHLGARDGVAAALSP
jgi:hypothetical protein